MNSHNAADPAQSAHDASVWADLSRAAPTMWVKRAGSGRTPPSSVALGLSDMKAAEARLLRFAPALAQRFADSTPDGVIESPLISIPTLTSRCLSHAAPPPGALRTFIKADHALPIAGSVKARGGIYEVLCVAERVALAARILADTEDDYRKLLLPESAAVFARHGLVVASTGNLGYAVGAAARAFGFATTVHMSSDAKTWKKNRLRALGAEVVEHAADYTSAVAAARASAANDDGVHFVDDEQSVDLFLGYSVAALRLAAQLRDLQIEVSERQPLCVYLPCGVGGAPGGVLFGLKALFGESVMGFFAEPTASPCMLMRLMSRLPPDACVYDLGLDNRTVADGLAVARASELVARLVGDQITAAYTVSDDAMLRNVALAHETEGLRLEPSATAGFPGAFKHVWESPQLEPRRDALAAATHVIWTTGGNLMPDAEFDALLGKAAHG